jgi:uncharacterized damage-inducible protein DinB
LLGIFIRKSLQNDLRLGFFTKKFFKMSLQKTNSYILSELIDHIEQLPQDSYVQKLPVLSGSSIGQHIRHIVEFYECLVKGIQSGTVNYDARKRNLELEQNSAFAVGILKNILTAIEDQETNISLTLETAFGTAVAAKVPSCFSRELTYLIEHTIHHAAIIRIGLQQAFPEINVSPDFGFAPSTIEYRNSLETASN